ncbi:MAG: hypothetical protein GEV07_20245 [Streptosporangiales bacterium]|nr:hypothetical protein [Streptosporangiales bacterium]
MAVKPTTTVPKSSLPVPVAERNWSSFVLGTVCTSTGIATWSFVIGGTAALFLNAKMGMLAMAAGALIGQYLVTLATAPVSTKHGVETTLSTKPQLGSRGAYVGLLVMILNAIGWNTVLMIFFGRAAASVLIIFGVIDDSSRTAAAIVCSVAGLLVLGFMVSRGARSLSRSGPIIAGCIALLAIYLVYLLMREYGAAAIGNASAIEPTENRLQNYTTVVEMLIGGTFGWWGYMGGIVRMVSDARKTVLPTMLGLGLAWALVAAVSLFGALMTGEADPTVWVPKITGDVGALVVLTFIAFANLGSTLVGVYVSTLAVKQTAGFGRRISWRKTVALVLAPMLLVLVFFASTIFDNIGIFMAFLGMVTGPMIGVQIADWFILGRKNAMVVSSLYVTGTESKYWYLGGFNPAGLVSLLVGSLTYLSILNPYTLIPNSSLFPYLTASLPAVLVGATTYVVLSKLQQRWRPTLFAVEKPASTTARESAPT